MTEAEWLVGTDPKAMLDFVVRRASARRLRLFAVAAACDVLAHNPDRKARGFDREDDEFKAAIERAEARAEGARVTRIPPFDSWVEYTDAADAAYTVLGMDGSVGLWLEDPAEAVPAAISALSVNPVVWLRDLFGNPFGPVAFDPRWRTADAVGLTRGIYEERAFDRLPLLADALMDAGCADEQVLSHCRSDGPHVRGCWVVDLVLGKE
jgi:hypothetical protein